MQVCTQLVDRDQAFGGLERAFGGHSKAGDDIAREPDNSARTLDDVAEHYRKFFLIVSDPDGPGPEGPLIVLTERDKKDIVAFLKLLD